MTTPDFWNANKRDSSEPNHAGGIKRDKTQSTERVAAVLQGRERSVSRGKRKGEGKGRERVQSYRLRESSKLQLLRRR